MKELYQAIKEHSNLEDETIIEAGNHGADCGFSGFIYNADCIEFWDDNNTLLQEWAQEQAEEFGHNNWLEMFSTFGRSDMLEIKDGFKVLGAWFALEEVGRWLENGGE